VSLNLAFMGAPAFAVPTLQAVVDAGHRVAFVYTQSPKPAGRGKAVQTTPVHQAAERLGLAVRTPRSMKAPEEIEAFRALNLDAAIVVAYGQILLPAVLDAPRLGCFNLHASLLPRWRGAAPVHRAVMAGDAETGVMVMRMEAGLDTGPVLSVYKTEIGAVDTTGTLHDRLSVHGASLVAGTLTALETGTAREKPQPETGVTYAKKLTNEETQIDWARPAREVDCFIRGLSPWPGAWTTIGGERVKVLMSAQAEGHGAAGTACDAGLTIACGTGAVRLLTLQRAGKTAQDAATFLRGFPVEPGTVLGA
jgi:methionyl-tRNA formyltransferase